MVYSKSIPDKVQRLHKKTRLGMLLARTAWGTVAQKHFMLLHIRIVVLVGNDSESDIHCKKSYITTTFKVTMYLLYHACQLLL